MSRPRLSRVGALEIDQHLDVQRASWRLQVIAWWAIAILIGLALAGIFSSGPLSRARIGDPAALEVEYARFERRTKPTAIPGFSNGSRTRPSS